MKPVTGLVLGSVAFTVGLVSGLTWVPASVADAIEYGPAGACQQPTANGSGCWSEVSGVVTGTHVVPRYRGNSNWVVDLSDGFGRQHPKVAHRDVFNHLTPGEPVSVRFWKGRVALIQVPGAGDLPTDDEPGRQLGIASVSTAFVVLAGLVVFLGALGVHRHSGSWMRSVSRAQWSEDLFDMVAPPVRLWFQAICFILFSGLAFATIAWLWFDVPLLAAAAASFGLAALCWAWSLHHRARTAMQKRSLPRKPR
ncbi:MAG: hypothetical protein M3Z28_13905 [Candidatus Dormibacteraeota bacterium]|nr:hypothetical protein [Candidatus Dormibacteraeota bacterium]